MGVAIGRFFAPIRECKTLYVAREIQIAIREALREKFDTKEFRSVTRFKKI